MLLNSNDFFAAVKDHLKLPDSVTRLVIEAEVNKKLTIYVKGYVRMDDVSPLVKAVADVTVSPNGDIEVVPFEVPAG